MRFIVEKRKITCTTPVMLISNNADYKAEFELDYEWIGKTITASFVNTNGEAFDVLLGDDWCCTIPESALSGDEIKVGVYTAGMCSTACTVRVTGSIKTGATQQAAPPEDVYSQILKLINETNERIGNIEDGYY